MKKRLRKRVVVVEIPLLGEMRRVELGVRLAGDDSSAPSGQKPQALVQQTL